MVLGSAQLLEHWECFLPAGRTQALQGHVDTVMCHSCGEAGVVSGSAQLFQPSPAGGVQGLEGHAATVVCAFAACMLGELKRCQDQLSQS